jgi:hypothetical protein
MNSIAYNKLAAILLAELPAGRMKHLMNNAPTLISIQYVALRRTFIGWELWGYTSQPMYNENANSWLAGITRPTQHAWGRRIVGYSVDGEELTWKIFKQIANWNDVDHVYHVLAGGEETAYNSLVKVDHTSQPVV